MPGNESSPLSVPQFRSGVGVEGCKEGKEKSFALTLGGE